MCTHPVDDTWCIKHGILVLWNGIHLSRPVVANHIDDCTSSVPFNRWIQFYRRSLCILLRVPVTRSLTNENLVVLVLPVNFPFNREPLVYECICACVFNSLLTIVNSWFFPWFRAQKSYYSPSVCDIIGSPFVYFKCLLYCPDIVNVDIRNIFTSEL